MCWEFMFSRAGVFLRGDRGLYLWEKEAYICGKRRFICVGKGALGRKKEALVSERLKAQ